MDRLRGLLLLVTTIFITAAAKQRQLIVAADATLSSRETDAERRRKRKAIEDTLPYMKNLYSYRGEPRNALAYRDRFGALADDPNRNYCKKLTHMYSWEILDLAELLKDAIEKPRQTRWRHRPRNPNQRGKGRPPKYNYINRLLFVLEWLSCGESGDKAEFEKVYSKTSIVEDKKHILKAINEVLHDQIRWPNAEERRLLYADYTGIFRNVVGIMDCTEHYIEKSKDPVFERDTYSGKAGTNTMKTLAVINKHGEFIYVVPLLRGRTNDRENFTTSDLYMNCGNYFSEGEYIASDGGFRGDGPNLVSYDVLDDESKAHFNLIFKEVRVGVENAFGRVQMWFPLLGVQKREWIYDLEMLHLAAGAAFKLHNWMLRTRGLSYNAESAPSNHYRDFY
jgi:DDE superfamily endonuclease